ncbi:MAG: hypothetical protein ABH919_02040 [bacterium]
MEKDSNKVNKTLLLIVALSIFFFVQATQDVCQAEAKLALFEKNLSFSRDELELFKANSEYWENLYNQQEAFFLDRSNKGIVKGFSTQELIFPQEASPRTDFEYKLAEKLAGNSLRKASVSEIVEFIKEDRTNERVWTENYDCSMFTFDTIWNAWEKGIVACPVELAYTEGNGHLLVVFPTASGSVFFEPQSDKIITNLAVGADYCKLAQLECEKNRIIARIEVAGKCR